MNDSDSGRRRALDDELQRLEESAKYSAQNQFEQAKQWRGINLMLGIPASALAAIAGAAALASTASAFWAGMLALGAAAFGAVLTTVNASHRTNQAASAANAYLEIQTAARQARLLDLPTSDIDEMRAIVAEITARRDEQNKTAEPPNRWARKRAQKNIKDGGQTYDVDSSDNDG
ncbi:SLATT domain-containing protein [Nocardia otitidiscaviarum]|uniref:SLATT domain-containing protein n=1 Tax=Nocardia otitidiscaviarum TaxID=1823 RepID=UPI0009D9512D|nr:SLATT domain-containing protein [Nocardia otitidiscaviarum]